MQRFPPPKIFTNALLGNHEITALIRDTEPHERSLFSLDPNLGRSKPGEGETVNGLSTNDKNTYGRKSIYANAAPVKQSAVARVLGNDMLYEIRQSSNSASRGKGGVNIEVLLRGAEKLCEVYSVAGATQKIASIRNRHQQFSSSVAEYQEKVLKQQSRLNRAQSGSGYGFEDEEVNHVEPEEPVKSFNEADLEAEQREIQELEVRKKELEDRLASMESDLGGLLR